MSAREVASEGLLRSHIGTALRRIRLSQGHTLRQLSRQASVSLGYLSEIERGQKEASSELLASICSALSFSIPQLLLEVSQSMQLAMAERSARPLVVNLTLLSLDNTSATDALNIEDAA